MDYQTLSPSGCAAEILEQILDCCGNDPALKDKLERLIRQKVRLVIEHCAMIAEDCAAGHLAEKAGTTLEQGDEEILDLSDQIAEEIRRFADERKSDRILHSMGISAE
jgi:hypothetical protein